MTAYFNQPIASTPNRARWSWTRWIVDLWTNATGAYNHQHIRDLVAGLALQGVSDSDTPKSLKATKICGY